MVTGQTIQLPRVGMFAIVRNRRGVVAAVEPYDGETGCLHLVHLEYKDDQHPVEEQLLWELEPRKTLLEPTALPDAGRQTLCQRLTSTHCFVLPDGARLYPISIPTKRARWTVCRYRVLSTVRFRSKTTNLCLF